MIGPVTGPLAGFVAASRWEDVPEGVRHAARRSILNFFGTALGGSRDAAIEGTLAVLRRFSGPRDATVIGHAEQARHAERRLRQCGKRQRVRLRRHPSSDHHPPDRAGRARAARARRNARRSPVRRCCMRSSSASRSSAGSATRFRRVTTGAAGTSRRPAACSVLRRRSRRSSGSMPSGCAWALGNASAQSSGLVETLGTMAKSIGVGASARGGLSAALLRRGRRHRPGGADRRAARIYRGDGRRRGSRRASPGGWVKPGS